MYNSLAKLLSYILHPVLMPTYLFGTLILSAPNIFNPLSDEGRLYVLFMVFLSTFLMPVLMLLVYMMVSVKHFSLKSLYMHSKNERVTPFLMTALFYLSVTYYLFSTINSNVLILMFGTSVTVLLVAIITFFWKISAHTAGISGVLSLLFFVASSYGDNYLLYPVAVIIILGGFLASSRLFLRAHTPSEILGGVLVGALGPCIAIYTLSFFN